MDTIPAAQARQEETVTVTLPFSLYRVEVALSRKTYTVNLTPNSSDMKGAYWGRNPRFRGLLVSRAKQEMRDAAYALTLNAPGRATVPQEGPLRVNVVMRTRTWAGQDADGAWAGLKWALDGLAAGLGTNDTRFVLGNLTFEKGEPEQTTMEVKP